MFWHEYCLFVLNVSIFQDTLQFATHVSIYSVVNILHIFLTEAYVCNVCRSSATTQLIHRFQITEIFSFTNFN